MPLRPMSRPLASIFVASMFALGGVVGYLIAITKTSNSVRSEETSLIFKALLKDTRLAIPQSGLHCDITGNQISDFVSSYLLWSQARTPRSSSSLSCEGDTVKKCTWVFGEAKSIEGWGRFLKFDYNPATQVIEPGSLECIDVP